MRYQAALYPVAGVAGIEPATKRLTVARSTAELHAIAYPKAKPPVGLEPTTYGLQNRCSIQLS